GNAHYWMARFFKHSNLCILRRIGGTPEPHVREDAIIAVELRWPKLFTIDGNNSFTLFAGRLSQQLFQPRAEIFLDLTGTQEAQASTISSVRSRNLMVSNPISAAGTMPKFE